MKLTSQISSIIVALLFIYSLNFNSIVTFDYLFHQEVITKLFCINKEKPKLQCNGKCHLTQELIKVDNKNEDSPLSQSNLSDNLEINLSLCENNMDIRPVLKNTTKQKYIISHSIICDGYSSIASPPPEV